jgi:hypothetical protein
MNLKQYTMTEAHYHLVVNHFPIIGMIFGVGILIAGIISKSNVVQNVSYVVFIITAIFAFLSLKTGGPAAGAVKGMPDITKEIIREHADVANKLAWVLYLLAILSITGLYANIKNHSKAGLVSFVTLIISFLAIYLAQHVGTSGGEIRHTEIREGYNASTHEMDGHEEEGSDD